MKKITVAHLIPGISSGGGAEAVVLGMCREMDREKFTPVLIYWQEDDALAPLFREAGVTLIRLPLTKVISFSSVRQLAAALKGCGAKILHTHFMDSDLLGLLASLICRIPMLTHVHSAPFPAAIRHALRYRVMSLWIKKVICVSEHVRRHVARRTGIASLKFEVIANGADLDRFRAVLPDEKRNALRASLGLPADARIIGSVSRLLAEKSLETLLEGAVIILHKHPQTRFLIVGSGEEEARLKALARTLGISAYVVFTGMRRDVPELLNIMDVFVFPATEEAFGLSLIEAMAVGRPVVAAAARAIPDIVRQEKDGLLFPPKDARALATAVLRLMDDPALWEHFSQAGLLRAQDFSSRRMAEKLEALYLKVLAA